MGENPQIACAVVGEELKAFLKPYPEIKKMLQEDLSAIGLANGNSDQACPEDNGAAEPKGEGAVLALSKNILGLWGRYPETLQALEEHEIYRIREENEKMDFMAHYLE